MVKRPLKTITKSADCFACPSPCCRFAKEDIYFAPVITDQEKKILKETGIKFGSSRKGKRVFLLKLKPSRSNKQIYVCPFLKEENGACLVYKQRPLDCSLWPFIFSKSTDGKKTILACFTKICPSLNKISTQEKKKYLEYLKNWLEEIDYKQLLKDYPELVWNYEVGTKKILTIF